MAVVADTPVTYAPMAGVPVLKEELQRKLFNTIEALCVRTQAGLLSKGQFDAAVDALFQTCCGLVSDDILEVVTEASELAGSAPVIEKRAFTKAGATAVLTWNVGEESFSYIAIGALGHKMKLINCTTPQDAAEKFETLCDRLKEGGWEEI